MTRGSASIRDRAKGVPRPYDRLKMDLGAQLRSLRKVAGLTGAELADRANMSQAKVSKLETGSVLASEADVREIATALDLNPDTLDELTERVHLLRSEHLNWRQLRAKGDAQLQARVGQREALASSVRYLNNTIVPGLLQTGAYAREVYLREGLTQEQAQAATAARMARQAVLYDERKQFDFLLTEGLLRTRIAPLTTMVGQLDRLQSAMALTNVSVGIIPWTSELLYAASNTFIAYDDEAVVVETDAEEIVLREAADVAFYSDVFDKVKSRAVFGEQARALLVSVSVDYQRLRDSA